MRILIWTGLLSISLLLPIRARADEASHRATVLELFKLTNMASNMSQQLEANLQAQLLMNSAIAPFLDTYRQFLAKYASWQSIEPELVALYIRTYTEPELKQLLAFYRTPLGKKSLRLMPYFMQQYALLSAERLREHMPELAEAIQEQSRREQGAATQQSIPAPPTRVTQPKPTSK
jgi:hypothetical protein